MGLDMTLNRKDGTEVAYWRKANQIRGWFASNIEEFMDNGITTITAEDLQNLLDDINVVLFKHEIEPAMELLPPTYGFFFGSDEIDDYYWETLKRTQRILQEELQDPCEEYDYWEWY